MISTDKERMTSSERMRAILSGERPDRVPFIPFAMGFAALISGFEIGDYYSQPETSFRAQLLFKEVLGHDGSPLYSYASFGAFEFGGKIRYPSGDWDQAPIVTEHPISSPEDVDRLQVPDVETAGYLPQKIQFTRLAAQGGFPLFIKLGTPFTIAGSVIGESLMFRWMIKKPELVHKVLRKVTDFLIKIAHYFTGQYGPERITGFDACPTEATQVISPDQFCEFALPYMMEVHEKVLAMGIKRFFTHVCGEQNMNLVHLQKVPMGDPGVLSFGHEVDLYKAIDLFGDKCIIAGNVDTSLIQLGTPEEVYEQTKQCILKGKKAPRGYILMPGCEMPPRAPWVNVYYMRKALNDFGFYDWDRRSGRAVEAEKMAKKTETVTSICGICPGGCGVNVELVDGKIEKIAPIKGHPIGVVCVRGVHSKEIVYSADRLQYPLLRVGEKGEGKFERITWDEAMDRIAQRLQGIGKEYGPQAVMSYFGRGSFEWNLGDVLGPQGYRGHGTCGFLLPFGSPNVTGVSAVCYVSYGVLAAVPTLGAPMRQLYSDFENADLVVAWGANPPTDSPPDKVKKIEAARKRGARVIAIDHMRSDIARKADRWIGVRPGTDGALALSMLKVIMDEGLYDREFVDNWTVGFEELRQYVSGFPPETAERITRVDRHTIVETARAIAGAKGASLVMYTGLEYTNSGVQNIRAVLSLWAVTGNLDVPGGLVFRSRNPNPFPVINLAPVNDAKPIGADKYPFFCDLVKSAQFMETPRAILNDDPYPIKALLIFGASLLTSLPNPELWKQCLRKLDFQVTFDRFMTADAMYADIVLPATTNYENLGYERYPGYCQLRQRVIEPVAEARSGYVVLTELAKRLGYGDLFPATEEDRLRFAFQKGPVSVEDLKAHPEGVPYDDGKKEYHKYSKGLIRSDGKPGFNTPSGKIELVSSLLQKYGYDGLPVYVEPVEGPVGSPELYREYPLVLNTGARLQSAFRSQHLNIPGLLKLQPKPQVLIHSADAQVRGISDGDSVWVESPRGKVGVWARVTDDVMSGQVELNVGGGSPIHVKEWREANANYLTDFDNRDPISGFPVYKALLCDVKKRD